MLSGNGTIDYSVEAHTLDAQETSVARQEPTTRDSQKENFNRRQTAPHRINYCSQNLLYNLRYSNASFFSLSNNQAYSNIYHSLKILKYYILLYKR